MDNTTDLLTELAHEVEAILITNEFGGLPHEVFLEWCVDELTEAGETEDLVFPTLTNVGKLSTDTATLIMMGGLISLLRHTENLPNLIPFRKAK